jgi:hypothetical protein
MTTEPISEWEPADLLKYYGCRYRCEKSHVLSHVPFQKPHLGWEERESEVNWKTLALLDRSLIRNLQLRLRPLDSITDEECREMAFLDREIPEDYHVFSKWVGHHLKINVTGDLQTTVIISINTEKMLFAFYHYAANVGTMTDYLRSRGFDLDGHLKTGRAVLLT